MATIIARAAENTHWYETDGRPRYTVTAKDGSQRPTTLRDARKMGLVPSVTTILKIMAKPGLEAWKLEQMLLAALTLPRQENEPEKHFIDRIVADSKEHAKQAAEVGTLVHESVESWYGGNRDVPHKEIATAFEKAVFDHFKTDPYQKWNTEVAFASKLGFGGKIDLYTNPNTAAPTGIVLDTKTKSFDDPDDVTGYDEHLMQLSAYRMGLDLPHARCANVFASVTRPGLIKIVEWSEEDLQRGWKMFVNLLTFWKLKHKFEEA